MAPTSEDTAKQDRDKLTKESGGAMTPGGVFATAKTKSLAHRLTSKYRSQHPGGGGGGAGGAGGRRMSILSTKLEDGSPHTTTSRPGNHKPAPRAENTYRTGPGEDTKLELITLQEMMEVTLMETIGRKRYVKDTCQLTCLLLANQIKGIAKREMKNANRHKLVTSVMISERKDQGISVASRCLWGITTDASVHASYQNDHIAAVAVLYIVYCE